MKNAPRDFRPIPRLSPFNALVGPLYERRSGEDISIGLHIEEKHTQLSIDYAGSAKVGDWIESTVEVQRVGARLAFANGYLVAHGRRIVRASAIFARSGDTGDA